MADNQLTRACMNQATLTVVGRCLLLLLHHLRPQGAAGCSQAQVSARVLAWGWCPGPQRVVAARTGVGCYQSPQQGVEVTSLVPDLGSGLG